MKLPGPVALRRAILAVTLLVGALGLTFMLTWIYPPFRGAVLFAAGRASTCSLAGAMRAPAGTTLLKAAVTRAQATSRLARAEGGLELWETEQGPFWTVKGSAREMLRTVLPEQAADIYGGNGLGVRRGDIVLDCGAHYGAYARHALKADARLVVAIEPDPDNLECLRRNLAAEIAQGRVVVYAKGVWDREDWLLLRKDPDSSAGHSFVLSRESGEAPARLPLTTIDKLAAELGLARVDFIKMDIEGAERRALAGARSTLARFRPRLAVAVYHLADDAAVIARVVMGVNPAYRTGCGFCIDWGYHLTHETSLFY